MSAEVALVLNQEGPVCSDEGRTAKEQEEQDVRQMVRRVVLQRQQDVEDEDSDFSD